MNDHLWIALWAACPAATAVAGELSGEFSVAAPAGAPRAYPSSAVGGLIAVIAAETCLLLIVAALLRRRTATTRLLGYLGVLAPLTLAFGSTANTAPQATHRHLVNPTQSSFAVLALVTAQVIHGRIRSVNRPLFRTGALRATLSS